MRYLAATLMVLLAFVPEAPADAVIYTDPVRTIACLFLEDYREWASLSDEEKLRLGEAKQACINEKMAQGKIVWCVRFAPPSKGAGKRELEYVPYEVVEDLPWPKCGL